MTSAPRPRTTTRDPEELGRRLTGWLDRHLQERAGGERSVTVDNEAGVVVIGDGNRVGFGTGATVRSAYREQVRR
ncbi:hypothetical protein ACWCQ0_53810, partial [Streptomyces massasporeus]